MPKNLIFTDKEAAFLRELVKNKVPFMVVGLSAATLQGAAVVTQDIDLWFEKLDHPGLRKALKKVGGIYVPPIGMNPPMLAGKHLEMFDIVLNMDGLGEFKKEIRNTVEIQLGRFKVRVLSLDRIVASKEAAGREKDKLVIPVLKETLKTLRSNREAF